MTTNFVAEMKWRGMLHDVMPGTEEQLLKEPTTAYIGFDPTADSLHIGSLVQIMILMHFQRAGHHPIALVGGATGMIGDPSGKSAERNLLDEKTLDKNVTGIKEQLSRFLDFSETTTNKAELVNNYDWMKDFSFIEFARDIGKHITVNYMMSKDSVKKRLGAESTVGMSFTEFTYQLFQGYDFLHLYREKNCLLQLGGSDQWGNITTGTELVRRVAGGKAYAITTPLLTKADGTKFGKTEGGNVWLDKARTSPYKFYQYWINATDEDAENYIKIFTFFTQDEIAAIVEKHQEAPHQRLLQRTLAESITKMVHGEADYENAVKASEVLFSKTFKNDIKTLDEATFLDVFEGVSQAEITQDKLAEGLDIVSALVQETNFLKSNGEAIRALKANSVSVNKEKVDNRYVLSAEDLINDRYIILNVGKKNTYIVKVKA